MSYVLHYAPDNASLIIRLALEELGVPYRTMLVDRRAKGQRSAAYLALNPAGRIPTLETPQGPISETGAILMVLAETHGGLLPGAGMPQRGAVLNWLFFIANTLHPETIQSFYVHRYGPQDAWPAMRAALRERVLGHLAVLETEAVTRCGGWFCGDVPSALDLYVAAILRWLGLYGGAEPGTLDLAAYPAMMDMCARLETRPSCAALSAAEGMSAHPFTAPQAPTPLEGTAT